MMLRKNGNRYAKDAATLFILWYPVGEGFWESENVSLEDANELIDWLNRSPKVYIKAYPLYEIEIRTSGMHEHLYGAIAKPSSDNDEGYLYRNCGETYFEAPYIKYSGAEAIELLRCCI